MLKAQIVTRSLKLSSDVPIDTQISDHLNNSWSHKQLETCVPYLSKA